MTFYLPLSNLSFYHSLCIDRQFALQLECFNIENSMVSGWLTLICFKSHVGTVVWMQYFDEKFSVQRGKRRKKDLVISLIKDHFNRA